MFIEYMWFIIWHVWAIAKSLFLRLSSKLHIIDWCVGFTLEAWERERDKGCEIKSDREGILGVLNKSLAFRVSRVLSFTLYLICLEMFKQLPSFYFTKF